MINVSGTPVAYPGNGVSMKVCGLLKENEIWFGKDSKAKRSTPGNDGTLFLDVPDDLEEGIYDVFVTNANGKSKIVEIAIE